VLYRHAILEQVDRTVAVDRNAAARAHCAGFTGGRFRPRSRTRTLSVPVRSVGGFAAHGIPVDGYGSITCSRMACR